MPSGVTGSHRCCADTPLSEAARGNTNGVLDPVQEQHGDTVRSGARDQEQQLASGRPSTTPFALVGVVALVLWTIAAVVAAAAFVVIWLV